MRHGSKIKRALIVVAIFVLSVRLMLSTPGKPYHLTDAIVTAYCPCVLCCSTKYADGTTASGAPADGFLLAAPSNIPFGTMIAVPGYAGGELVPVLDRGGAIKDNRIDVLMPTHEEALRWGKQYLTIKVMESN